MTLIFGANGQDGIYLKQLLNEHQIECLGITRNPAFSQNIWNFDFVCDLVKKYKPEFIFHLAANSSTRHDVWQQNHEIISTGSLNILEAVKLYSPATKIFLSGSGLQFINNGVPIKETDPFDPSSMYSVSRIHTVYAARYYRSLGLKVYVGYFFNHDSPFRNEKHVNKKITETVKRIAKGSNEKLIIGDLSVKKEFGFAGDIVIGIFTFVSQEQIFESVIGTGKAYTIKEWVKICFSIYDLDWQEFTEQLDSFKSEYKILVSDPHTIKSIGWEAKTDIHLLAKMMCQ